MTGDRGFTPSPIALAVILSASLHLAALNYPGFRHWLGAEEKRDDHLEVVLKDMSRIKPSGEKTLSRQEHQKNQEPAEAFDPPVPLDTDDPRYQSYFSIIRGMIAEKWVYPEHALKKKRQGSVIVEFHLARDGSLIGVRAADSSGNSDLDQAAMNAVKDASPYPRRPDAIKRDPFIISALFVYGK